MHLDSFQEFHIPVYAPGFESLVALMEAGADNLVPMELALKIASKISANERFSAYIVIPMYPEGVPTSSAMQEILFWQVRLISHFLYTKIYSTVNLR